MTAIRIITRLESPASLWELITLISSMLLSTHYQPFCLIPPVTAAMFNPFCSYVLVGGRDCRQVKVSGAGPLSNNGNQQQQVTTLPLWGTE